ncbi:MAG: DUF3419 family protein [Pseudomonadota bacterium]
MSEATVVKEQLSEAVHQNRAFSITGILERIFSTTFRGLVYPQIWEDPVVDMEALDIQETDHIVCIASGGCNAMSYLTRKPASITSVDLSPAHVALNRMKSAAVQHLPNHEAFFRFFGLANVEGNREAFETYVLPHLDSKTAEYWTDRKGLFGKRIDVFEEGFYRGGLLGHFIGVCHFMARISGVNLKTFVHCQTKAGQALYYKDNVEPLLDKKLIRMLINNRATLFGLGIPPQQYEALAGSANGDMHAVLKERTRALMCDFPLSENYFAWQAFNRSYKQDGSGPLPPYLQEENFETLRAQAHKYETLNRSLTDYLGEQGDGSKDIFILLDAQDWMNDDQLNALWSEINRTAAPGARVIFRTAGLETILPGRVKDEVLSQWNYHSERSKELTKQDRSAIYGGFHLYTLDG